MSNRNVRNEVACRGYITARPVCGNHVPQRVQNTVVRDYAQRMNIEFKLSEVEYIMPGCYIILNSVLEELAQIDGMIAYSLFLLPEYAERRLAVYDKVFSAGAKLHCAVENFTLSTRADVQRAEDIFLVNQASLVAEPQC